MDGDNGTSRNDPAGLTQDVYEVMGADFDITIWYELVGSWEMDRPITKEEIHRLDKRGLAVIANCRDGDRYSIKVRRRGS